MIGIEPKADFSIGGATVRNRCNEITDMKQ